MRNKKSRKEWMFHIFDICMYLTIITYVIAAIGLGGDLLENTIEIPFCFGIIFVLYSGAFLGGMMILSAEYLFKAVKEKDVKVLLKIVVKIVLVAVMLMFLLMYNDVERRSLLKLCGYSFGIVMLFEGFLCYLKKRREYKINSCDLHVLPS